MEMLNMMMSTMPTMDPAMAAAVAATPATEKGMVPSLFADLLLGMQVLPEVAEGDVPAEKGALFPEEEKNGEETSLLASWPVPLLTLDQGARPNAVSEEPFSMQPSREPSTPVIDPLPMENKGKLSSPTIPMLQEATTASGEGKSALTAAVQEGREPVQLAGMTASALPVEEAISTDRGEDEPLERLTQENGMQPSLRRSGREIRPPAEIGQAKPEDGGQIPLEHGKGEQVEVVFRDRPQVNGEAMKTELPAKPKAGEPSGSGEFQHLVSSLRESHRNDAPAASSVKEATSESILSQVKEGLVAHDGKGNGRITLKLSPEELGNLQITVNLDEGRLKVEIVAENATVKEALMGNLESLKETLLRQNLRMERFDVATGGENPFHHFERNSGDRRENPKAFQAAAAFLNAEVTETQEKVYLGDRRNGLVDLRL